MNGSEPGSNDNVNVACRLLRKKYSVLLSWIRLQPCFCFCLFFW
jgi:hypothetical protein